MRDRDQIYGAWFRSRIRGMGISEVVTAHHSPWQNPYAERVIGTIRRECTNHLMVLGENHLRRLMKQYVRYYNESRPHSSLEGNSPIPRDVDPPERGQVVAEPVLGGRSQVCSNGLMACLVSSSRCARSPGSKQTSALITNLSWCHGLRPAAITTAAQTIGLIRPSDQGFREGRGT